jgi:hypothetical protein
MVIHTGIIFSFDDSVYYKKIFKNNHTLNNVNSNEIKKMYLHYVKSNKITYEVNYMYFMVHIIE